MPHQKTAASARRPLHRIETGCSAVAVDDHRFTIAVVVTIMIATLPDHNGFVTIPALADHFAIAMIPVAVTTDGSDGHTARTNTYANFFRTSRHCDANSGRCDGKYCQTPDHCMLLGLFSL
jgi:hypothetical protein